MNPRERQRSSSNGASSG
ncbi:Protein of unknown function, partial [Gryllus bimaculatus]